jgi:hypothetical protein
MHRIHVVKSCGKAAMWVAKGEIKRAGGRGLISFIIAVILLATLMGEIYIVAIVREPLSPTEQILFTLLELTLGCYLAYGLAASQASHAPPVEAFTDDKRTLSRTREIYHTTRRLKQIIDRKRQLVTDPVLLESFDVIQSVVDELQAGIVASHNDMAGSSGEEQRQMLEVDELKAKQQEIESRTAILELQDEIRDRQSAYAQLHTIQEALRSAGRPKVEAAVPVNVPAQPVLVKIPVVPEVAVPEVTVPEVAAEPAAKVAAGGYTVHSLTLGGAKDGSKRSRGK